ncbi:hypothetical protein BDZ89DRAFT_1166272 [Hymenopellis radicata]|nr:hypothetical protein BDZ89DRAFT_1166272 [Hymenopellis radicata]
MSLSLEDINVSLSFTGALDVPIIQETSLSLDTLEFVWGLNRGQVMSYFNLVPGNILRLQPELKKAIELEKVALCPPNAVMKKLAALQDRNMKQPLSKRRMFTEVSPFQAYEYRIVPVAKSVTLYSRDPSTRKVSILKGTKHSFPSFTCEANPAFVLTFASDGLLNTPKFVRTKLAFETAPDDCFRPWQTLAAPPLAFYEGSYVGEFGRPVPVKYRDQLPKSRPVPMVVDSDESEESFEELQPTLKRRKVEDVSGEGVDAAAASDLVDSVEAVLMEARRKSLREKRKRL